MIRNPFWHYAAILAIILIGLTGCLKRTEEITIADDGRVKMRVSCGSSAGEDSYHEMYGGDAVPSSDAGWRIVEQRAQTNDEGKTEHILVAERSFAAAEKLPASFAKPGDPNADLYLLFPTELRREKRDDGEYFHFSRRYPRREFDELEHYRRMLLEEPLREMEQGDASELSRENRIKLIEGAVELEKMKMIMLARRAFRAITPETEQDRWLAVWQTIRSVVDDVDAARLASLMEKDDSEEHNADLFESEVKALKERLTAGLKSTLREQARYTDEQVESFLRHYRRGERYVEITDDLRDDAFEIKVEMPGRIVASNADSIEGNVAKWEIMARSLVGVDVELLVTSRVNR